MTIPTLVEDAKFLIENDRHLAALSLLLLAVAGSSRRKYPDRKNVGDGQAFKWFLGGMIRKLLLNDENLDAHERIGISVEVDGKQLPMEDVLYKYYRCALVHEGQLSAEVAIVPSRGGDLRAGVIGGSISLGPVFEIDYRWIGVLTACVVQAPCNGALFGIEHNICVLKADIDEKAFEADLKERFGLSDAKLEYVVGVVKKIGPENVIRQADIVSFARGLIESFTLHNGALLSLRTDNIRFAEDPVYYERAADLLKSIAIAYETKRVV
ncbi:MULTISPECIES: hypothetical protein [unclassified Pseudomonas]|uniref:hypothetical protein n=1 Tax=unclassified Pseudomonas TaxID=196821 RepID=UPI00131BFDBC|nr:MULTISPECIES: hypothetical protein [unclassified Pseudomonas]